MAGPIDNIPGTRPQDGRRYGRLPPGSPDGRYPNYIGAPPVVPESETIGDLIRLALKTCTAFGTGQVPLAEDANDALRIVNYMLQSWSAQNYMLWTEVDVPFRSSGQRMYTVGPGGDVPVVRPKRLERAFVRLYGGLEFTPGTEVEFGGDFNSDFSSDFDSDVSVVVPEQSENAIIYPDGNKLNPQLGYGFPGFQSVDYPLTIVRSYEDYARISFKGLRSFPQYAFYQTTHPLAKLYVWPIPDHRFEVHLIVKEQFTGYTELDTPIGLPNEYREAIHYNLILRLWELNGIAGNPTTIMLAKNARDTLAAMNLQLQLMELPFGFDRNRIGCAAGLAGIGGFY